jgi:hypothetical protein
MENLLMILEAAANSPQVIAFAGAVMLALAGCCFVGYLLVRRK